MAQVSFILKSSKVLEKEQFVAEILNPKYLKDFTFFKRTLFR